MDCACLLFYLSLNCCCHFCWWNLPSVDQQELSMTIAYELQWGVDPMEQDSPQQGLVAAWDFFLGVLPVELSWPCSVAVNLTTGCDGSGLSGRDSSVAPCQILTVTRLELLVRTYKVTLSVCHKQHTVILKSTTSILFKNIKKNWDTKISRKTTIFLNFRLLCNVHLICFYYI